ncbi:MAG: tripartite tricarboxylate transporter TctB family protein [Desulfarculaceae bacterium]|jgi:hypothetical protein
MIKNPADFKLGAGLAAFCLFLLVYLIPRQVGPLLEPESLMPLLITLFILGLSALLILKSLREAPAAQKESHDPAVQHRLSKMTLAVVVAVMAAYAWLLGLTGFLATSLVAMVVLFVVFGVKDIKKIAIITIVTLGLLYFSFEKFLNAPLPEGLLIENWLY